MKNNIKLMSIVLGFLIFLFLINKWQQNKLNSSTNRVFNIEKEDVFGIEISTKDELLSLTFDGEKWSIDDHDSLEVKIATLNSFFDKVLTVEKTVPVSKNKKKWDKFMVGDSTGTRLVFEDFDGKTLAEVVIGRSSAEWSSSNIRIESFDEVFQTNENVNWLVNVSPTYWGEIPSPDTSSINLQQ